MIHIKKDDQVKVLSGDDHGKVGRVLRVFPDKRAAIVEKLNFIKRHTRENPQRNMKGGIVEREAPIDLSNLQVVCPECGKSARVGYERLEDGRKIRVCKKCKGVLDRR